MNDRSDLIQKKKVSYEVQRGNNEAGNVETRRKGSRHSLIIAGSCRGSVSRAIPQFLNPLRSTSDERVKEYQTISQISSRAQQN